MAGSLPERWRDVGELGAAEEMTHGTRCSGSVLTAPSKCGCACEKMLHGMPRSERGSALFGNEATRPKRAKRRESDLRQVMNRETGSNHWSSAATDWVAAKITEKAVAVGFEPDAVLRDISDATLNALFTAVRNRTITGSVADRVDAVFQRGHVFCSLAVAVLKLADAAEELRDDLRDELVTAIVDRYFDAQVFDNMARSVVRGALTAGIDAGLHALTAATQYDAVVKSVRLLGILTCPDVDDHPADDVTRYCLEPLAKEFLSARLIAWVRAWLPVHVKP